MTRRNADRPIRDVQDFCPDQPRRWPTDEEVAQSFATPEGFGRKVALAPKRQSAGRWRLWPFVALALLAVAAVAWGDEPATCGMPVERIE